MFDNVRKRSRRIPGRSRAWNRPPRETMPAHPPCWRWAGVREGGPQGLPDRDGVEVRPLRWDAAINSHVSESAPRLLWHGEAGRWLALGFEHVEGRHADYTRGSVDLEVVAKTLTAFQALPCPDLVNRCAAGGTVNESVPAWTEVPVPFSTLSPQPTPSSGTGAAAPIPRRGPQSGPSGCETLRNRSPGSGSRRLHLPVSRR